MAKLITCSARVAPEIAEAVAAYAKQHGITKSHAMSILLAAGTNQPEPPTPKVGKPPKIDDEDDPAPAEGHRGGR